MALWTGDWDINGNGWEGKLTITAVDAQGRVTGSVYGDQILGFWDDVSKKITFMRLTNPGDPSTFQTYTGYLGVTQPERSRPRERPTWPDPLRRSRAREQLLRESCMAGTRR